jgi:hypothetical protein
MIDAVNLCFLHCNKSSVISFISVILLCMKTLHEDLDAFMKTSLAQFSECETFWTYIIEKIKKHNFYSVFFFFFENRAVCDIPWKNMVESQRPQVI